MSDDIVLPGTYLGHYTEKSDDENVHVKDAVIYSTVLGTVEISQISRSETRVVNLESIGSVVPYVGAIVHAQVAKITRKQAECQILCIDDTIVEEGYKGVIMNSNIHESKTLDTTIYEWFKPGDYVKAKVISVSDPKQFVLSTAQRDLGVVRIEADEEMFPISWKFFLGAKSGKVEKRKVAKS